MAASKGGPVRLNAQASVQATEDVEKVRVAMENIFPQELRSKLKFKTSKLRGHYHNPIIRIEIQLVQPALVEQTLIALGSRLSAEDREQIAKTFESRIDRKGRLFLRVDKQEAYQGLARIINRGDSIRLVIRFSGRKPSQSDLEILCRQFNLI